MSQGCWSQRKVWDAQIPQGDTSANQTTSWFSCNQKPIAFTQTGITEIGGQDGWDEEDFYQKVPSVRFGTRFPVKKNREILRHCPWWSAAMLGAGGWCLLFKTGNTSAGDFVSLKLFANLRAFCWTEWPKSMDGRRKWSNLWYTGEFHFKKRIIQYWHSLRYFVWQERGREENGVSFECNFYFCFSFIFNFILEYSWFKILR